MWLGKPGAYSRRPRACGDGSVLCMVLWMNVGDCCLETGMRTNIDLDDALIALGTGRNRDPFAILGPHPHESGRGLIIRTFQPSARAVDVRLGNGEWHAVPMH